MRPQRTSWSAEKARHCAWRPHQNSASGSVGSTRQPTRWSSSCHSRGTSGVTSASMSREASNARTDEPSASAPERYRPSALVRSVAYASAARLRAWLSGGHGAAVSRRRGSSELSVVAAARALYSGRAGIAAASSDGKKDGSGGGALRFIVWRTVAVKGGSFTPSSRSRPCSASTARSGSRTSRECETRASGWRAHAVRP
mmetsp:Transcript_939/g.2437  ORF Transcript_939/g.2437 Transcript_939/m.2437 type:complete len:200 (+) Transcript_939:2630-3229(+)